MKRPLRPEEARLWGVVAATVRARPGRSGPVPAEPAPAEPAPARQDPPSRPLPSVSPVAGRPAALHLPAPRKVPRIDPGRIDPGRIEPGRKRRIAREREPLGGRLDLHGLDQDRARAALHGFVARAHDEGARAVLIITGKGVQGDGILRRRVPDWLAEPPTRARVAGYAPAERHHGGEGALYVALKRKGR